MHHRSDLEALDGIREPSGVREIRLRERPPAHGFGMAPDKTVIGDRPVSGSRQALAGVAADIAGAAGHQDRLSHAHRL